MKQLSLFFVLIAFALFSCEEDEGNNGTDYNVPSTYDFSNVNYSGQTERILMLSEMKAYLSQGNAGAELESSRLKAMFSNGPEADFTQSYNKQLKDKTFPGQTIYFEALMDRIELASQSNQVAAPGTPGVVSSNDGAKSYLVGPTGVEYAQLIEKGLMGACFYYQATSVYLGEDRMNADNETVEEGVGTAMEHHWDEAFGYFGVPEDFPSSLDGLAFWGVYCNRRDPFLNSNNTLMDAFLQGRAAISNKDYSTRDESISAIRSEWEKVSAATAINYLNTATREFDDNAIKFHALSEAIAFIYSMKFNEEKTVSNEQIDDWITEFTGSSIVEDMNLYNTTVEDMQSVKDQISTVFGFDDFKDEL